ncbi:MAG: hypothetical protein V7701_17800, partial [Sneathiella sp.]
DFRPSEQLSEPYVIAAMNLQAADTKEEADYISTSLMQGVIKLATGNPVQLPPPVKGFGDQLGPQEQAVISRFMTYTALGDPDDVRNSLIEFKNETAADEIIVTAQIFDHTARLRAFEIIAEAAKSLDK